MPTSNKISFRQVKRNVVLSITVQIISLGVSFILNLILPKYIDEANYALWQSFLLYSGYVGILHFGLLDGIVLRYSQYDYEELDKARISSQFRLMLSALSVFCLTGIIVSSCVSNTQTSNVILFVAITILTKNLFTYNSYLLQLTNRINNYATVIIGQRISFGFLVIVFIIIGIQDFRVYCCAEILGDLYGSLIASRHNRGLYFSMENNIPATFYEGWKNISAGVNILFATWASILFLGSARMIIQWHWGLLIFGKVSFAFSLSHLALSLVTAISVVLFPSIKRIDKEKLPLVYKKIRTYAAPLLVCILILYYPGCCLLRMWLPKYADSLVYLGMTLPIIVYSTEVNLLTNNYLKAYRKERTLFSINIVTLVVAICGYVIIAYLFDNLYLLLLWAVFVVAARSIVSELIVEKMLGIQFKVDHLIELVMTIIFIYFSTFFQSENGWIYYGVAVIFYLLIVFLKQNSKREIKNIA